MPFAFKANIIDCCRNLRGNLHLKAWGDYGNRSTILLNAERVFKL